MIFPGINLHLFIRGFPSHSLPEAQTIFGVARTFRMLLGPACEVLLEPHHCHKATRTAAASRKNGGDSAVLSHENGDIHGDLTNKNMVDGEIKHGEFSDAGRFVLRPNVDFRHNTNGFRPQELWIKKQLYNIFKFKLEKLGFQPQTTKWWVFTSNMGNESIKMRI